MRALFGALAALALGGLVAQATASELVNYGDPNLTSVLRRLRQVETGAASRGFRIVQLGDSHTAADHFTGALRARMQARFGDAGLGWLPPGRAAGHRTARAVLTNDAAWEVSVLRGHPDAPPGGAVGRAAQPGGGFGITLPEGEFDGLWKLTVIGSAAQATRLQVTHGGGTDPIEFQGGAAWHAARTFVGSAAQLRISADDPSPSIAGIALDRLAPGVVVDAIGLNGATVAAPLAWRVNGLQALLESRPPDILAVAFGTNEAYDRNLDPERYAADLDGLLQWLRSVAPRATLLLITPPAIAPRKGVEQGDCEGAAMRKVREVQRAAARRHRVLMFDWQRVMGGPCAARRWARAEPRLASPDGVHLTAAGYERTGETLYELLMRLYDGITGGP